MSSRRNALDHRVTGMVVDRPLEGRGGVGCCAHGMLPPPTVMRSVPDRENCLRCCTLGLSHSALLLEAGVTMRRRWRQSAAAPDRVKSPFFKKSSVRKSAACSVRMLKKTGDNRAHGKKHGTSHPRQGRTLEAVSSKLWFGRALRCHPVFSHRAPSPHSSSAMEQSVSPSVSHGRARRYAS